MAVFKVDPMHFHYNRSSGKLEVWCFNNESAYSEKHIDRVVKYDFGRIPGEKEGSAINRKQKLLVGLYRQPYRDGWKYIINEKVHPHMVKLVFDYIFYGWKLDENGAPVPSTYLRYNRKALGIHYLFLRYYECHNEAEAWNKEHPKYPIDYRIDFNDFNKEPYFPAPASYDGYNHGQSI